MEDQRQLSDSLARAVCTKADDCKASSHFGDCQSMNDSRRRIEASLGPLERAIRDSMNVMSDAADLTNEDLELLEVRFSYLHDRLELVWKNFALETKQRQADGRLPKPENSFEEFTRRFGFFRIGGPGGPDDSEPS